MSDRTDVQSLTQSIPAAAAAAAAAGRHCATVVFYRNGPRRQLQEGLAVSVRCTPRGGKTGVPSPAEVLLPAVCQQARQQPLSYSKRNILNLTFQPCPCGGLPEVAVPYPDMWQDCRITFPHTRQCYAKSSYRSVDPQTLHGNVHQVDHVPNGPTNSAAITTMFPLRLCGGKLLVAVTRERRYGPSRLRVNDDDDDDDDEWVSEEGIDRTTGEW